jgi:predicted ATPase
MAVTKRRFFTNYNKPNFLHSRIVDTIRQIAPFFDNFVLKPLALNPNYIQLHWRSRHAKYQFGPHQLSDGTLRTIALLMLLLQPESDLPSLIVLDEAELFPISNS